jgi:peroxiredoxin
MSTSSLENDRRTTGGSLERSPAPDIEMMDAAGLPVRLSSFWQAGPTAFVFVRHLGCLFCREQLKDLRANAADIARAGLALVVITPDRPDVVTTFAAGYHAPFPILSDPRRTAYQAYGLTEGSGAQLLNPHVVARSFVALARGNMQGRSSGASTRQLPGAAIVDRDGQIVFHQLASDSSDHVGAAQLIAVAGELGLAR